MMNDRRRLPVFFYRTEAGHEPVREWLQELDPQGSQGDRDRSSARARTVAHRYAGLQEPWERSLGGPDEHLEHRTARVLFFVDEDRIGVVHGFVKKTQKTPEADLELARKRMKEMKQ